MRGTALLAAVLLATAAWAQVDPPDGERPPDRPAAEEGPPPARPAASAQTPPDDPVAEAAPPPVASSAEPVGPPRRETLRESHVAFSACLLALHVAGAAWEVLPGITGEQRDCGIARPVRLAEALPGLALDGAPPMRCETARALAWWLRDHVLPAASRLPGAPRPVALSLGTAYECRGVVGGDGGNALSEHAFGNALDIAALRFDNGESLDVSRSGGPDMAAAFVAAIRGAACLYFTTVLGPGSNAAHEDHLHLDVKARNGGYRICE